MSLTEELWSSRDTLHGLRCNGVTVFTEEVVLLEFPVINHQAEDPFNP